MVLSPSGLTGAVAQSRLWVNTGERGLSVLAGVKYYHSPGRRGDSAAEEQLCPVPGYLKVSFAVKRGRS